jgi:hypothetical protein
MLLPQMGLRFGFAPAPGNESKTDAETATMKSASVLKMPHEPRPGA